MGFTETNMEGAVDDVVRNSFCFSTVVLRLVTVLSDWSTEHQGQFHLVTLEPLVLD